MEITSEEFNRFLLRKGLSDRKRSTTNSYLTYFDKVAHTHNFTEEDINKFLDRYNSAVPRAFIKNYLVFINRKDLLDKVPKLTGRKKKRILKILSKEEILKILSAFENPRNKVMLLLTWEGALRVGELINIKVNDFNWNAWKQKPSNHGVLKVIGKGDKEREVYVSKEIMVFTKKFINEQVSSNIITGADNKIFNIGKERWRIILAKASQTALGHSINPHSIRHFSAVYLLRGGLDIVNLAAYLGHDNTVTTCRYLHEDREVLKNKFDTLFNQENKVE